MFRALNDSTAVDSLMSAAATLGPVPGQRQAGHETMLRHAFRSLPSRWRQAIWTVDVLGCEVAELAAALDLDPAAAGSLLARARQALRARMQELERR
ncbi:sigma factor-like helix-turn-helix DNA-binding protein [Prauserella sp. PE36]|uniref:sigma factor-like helix-turn-helix DNA-binding protein n=1 Tax=Prauserella sp. PE36 TaxID=1504709 RepID=UPI000D9698A6|nr:sigma factor-like helix-turn-helix DNA-binding protein [Prauserella sp. PE36]PXY23014.1 hypothetical protein BAY59_25160 [Prauserella coralliicola]